MRLGIGRKKPAPTGRRRVRSDDVAAGRQVFSYSKQRSEEPANTGRNLQREAVVQKSNRFGSFWAQRFGLLILLIATIFSLINVATLSPHATIITPEGQRSKLLRDASTYQAAVDKLLAASPTNRTKLTINSTEISRKFSKQFPEVASASLVLPLAAHRPLLYIEPAQAALILVAQNGSYVVDTSGRVLLPSSQLPSDSNLTLPVVNDQSNLVAKVGEQALATKEVQSIRTIIGQLSAKGVTLSAFTLPPGTSELDATVSDAPYQVKFNLQSDDARQQAGSFLAVQAELKRTNTTPAKYIDVRVPGRAYYQ